MAPTFGKLEGRITVPTGGWATTVGAGTATLTAGNYYMGSGSTFLAEVATRFATAASTTCDVTASLGEAGTGIVTITFGSAKAITWVDTEVRDLLGFESNSSSATSHVGTLSARSVWMPTCAYWAKNSVGNWTGRIRGDFRSVSNSAGYVSAFHGQKRRELELRWSAVKRERIWVANEATGCQSLEQFWLDQIWGEASWASPGGPIRFYPDAAQAGTFATYMMTDAELFDPEQASENYVGSWVVRMPPMIEVPA
jgi:hypothetical protein